MATPSTLPTTPNAVPGNLLPDMFGVGTSHAEGINQMLGDLYNAWVKIGPGSSSPDVRGKALISGAGGVGLWDRNARKNMLVNGTGRTKQRTTMPTTDNSYGFDRARLLMENTNGFTISQETGTLPPAPGPMYGMRHTVGSGNNGKGGYWQPILFADMDDVAGGVVSLQCKLYISNARLANMRVGLMQWTGTADNGGTTFPDPITTWGADGTNPTPSGSWAFANTPASQALAATTWTPAYVENQSISSSAKDLAIMVWCDARTTTVGDFFIVTDIQLERGAVCSAAERISGYEEKLRCLDWLEVIGGEATNITVAAGGAYSINGAAVSLKYQPKRAVPTISFTLNGGAVANWSLLDATGAGVALTSCSAANTGLSNTGLTCSTGGGLTAAQGTTMFSNSANARITIIAEP